MQITGVISWHVDWGDGVWIERFLPSLARYFLLSLLLHWLMGGSAFPKPEHKLSTGQTILEAHHHLITNGWSPAPESTPTPEELRWSAVGLTSLSACSGTGVGHCRFGYRRDLQKLSVVTVPDAPGCPRVERWW